MAKAVFVLWLAIAAVPVFSDIYMHNPRGSNNRLDEANRERANANRMFDSQNNNRGGYNVGSLYYYDGSDVPIEWTNQHQCGGPNAHCELVIQYLCSDYVRDGVSTTTIPENQVLCSNYDCNADTRYGMHETFDYYVNCKTRERNLGLFTADQPTANAGNNDRQTARYTRQNPNGNRYAYECPEERDYYPYWHPSPWRDIAVLTNNASRCPYYEEESQNVKGTYACVLPYDTLVENAYNDDFVVPNTEGECEDFEAPGTNERGVWTFFEPHGIEAPVCRETQFSRDNHLGNGIGGHPNVYNWTIPRGIYHERCALRIRYNISTGEYNGWDGSTTAEQNAPNPNQDTLVDLSQRFGFANLAAAADRGYSFENNPQVEIFDDDEIKLRLAVNTAQYGRTFEDRSFTFEIRQRPAELESATIANLNVRGKRGNIVQVYPAVEYDFVPNTLKVSPNDYVHFQWTGSNTNPRNNDGQGLAGTDRSNVVLQAANLYESIEEGAYPFGVNGDWGRSYPDHLTNTSLMELSLPDKRHLALLTTNQFRGEMSELDDAGTYFDLGPRKATTVGVSHYMCTRNNNFSNRSQKGKIDCTDVRGTVRAIGENGGTAAVGNDEITVDIPRGTFSGLILLQVDRVFVAEGERRIRAKGHTFDAGDFYASDFVFITPQNRLAVDGMAMTVRIRLYDDAPSDPTVYYTNERSFGSWRTVEGGSVTEDGRVFQFQTAEGGVYVARGHSKAGLIAGIVVAVLVVLGIVIGVTVWYCRRNPKSLDSVRNVARGVKGSV